jgi:argininosuccinate synthase
MEIAMNDGRPISPLSHETRRIRSFDELLRVGVQSKHIVTLFSGGLDSSYLLYRLADSGCKVTALAVDVGAGVDAELLGSVASRFGANLKVVDARVRFAELAVLPAIRANARYMGMYPISASLSRPVIAQCAVEYAAKADAQAIIHTANLSQNSLRRLNGAICQLGFAGWFGTPYERSVISRHQKRAELSAAGLDSVGLGAVSGDCNLWCREFESGYLENPEDFAAPEELFEWTSPSVGATSVGQLSVKFVQGVPIELDDKPLPLVRLIEALNIKAGAYTIGRFSGLEHLENGEKVLEVREAPAAAILLDAYRHIETAVFDAEMIREKMVVEQLWVREAVEGRWFGRLREACEAFISHTARQVTGRVEYKLVTGQANVCSIRASQALYLTDREAWEVSHAEQLARR